VYIALGTTRSKTPDPDLYARIDRDLPIRLAELAQAGGCRSVQVVSAVGADAASGVTYNRLKGEMETGVAAAFQKGPVVFFRPGLLLGNRSEVRLGEKIGEWVFALANPLLRGTSAKYRSISAQDVARAMIASAEAGASSTVCHYPEMMQLAQQRYV
jgi:uncharacterized protein YbjT (DUF2867 family)